MFKLEGVNSAMMTAFNQDFTINEPVMRDWVDFMIENGINGLFPGASIGEFHCFTTQDNYRLMDIVQEQAAGRVPVIAGVAASATDISVKLAKYAEKIGCAAVLTLPPYYGKVSQDIIRKHYEKIAQAVDLPVIMYNIPQTVTGISRETFTELLNIPNIMAIKDSSGNMVELAHMIRIVRERGRTDFSVMTGWDDILYPALHIGASGCLSGVSGVIPELMVPIYHEFKAGNYEKALKLQESVLPIFAAMSQLQFPAGYKLGLELRGFETGPNRLPAEEVDCHRYLSVRKQIQDEMSKLLGSKLVVRKQ